MYNHDPYAIMWTHKHSHFNAYDAYIDLVLTGMKMSIIKSSPE